MLAALVALLALALSGCGGEVASDPNTLVFKYGKISMPPERMREVLDGFTRENPGCRVNAETLPSSSDQQHQYYALNLEGGQSAIDVMALDVVWVQEFARAGWIDDLTDLWPASERGDALPAALAAATWRGRVWAVPWYTDAGLLYYRKDLLEKYGLAPPRTLDELATGARRVLDGERRESLRGFVWQGKQYEGLVCAALEMVRGLGGEVLDPEGRVVLDAEASIAAMERVRHLIDSGVSPALVATLDEETARILFLRGDAVFLRNWPYAFSTFEEAGSPVRGKTGIAPVPGGAATLGGWQLAVNRASGRKALARKFLEYLRRPAVQRAFALHAGLKPPRRSLYADPKLVADEPFMARLLPILDGARARPTTPYYLMISQELQLEMSAVVAGIRTPRDAMGRAAARIRRILSAGQD
jgi:multiple sugar transport system substrate-binding protein